MVREADDLGAVLPRSVLARAFNASRDGREKSLRSIGAESIVITDDEHFDVFAKFNHAWLIAKGSGAAESTERHTHSPSEMIRQQGIAQQSASLIKSNLNAINALVES